MFSVLEHHFPVLERPFLLCPVLSRVPSRILAVPARPVPWQDFELVPLSLCPGTKKFCLSRCPEKLHCPVPLETLILTGHVIFKLCYNQIYQLKTTIIILHFFFQNLLGLRAKTWKLLMNATSDLNEDWLNYKRDEIGHAQLYYLDMNALL